MPRPSVAPSLDPAFVAYRAGDCAGAVAFMTELLRGSIRSGMAARGSTGAATSELAERGLVYLEEIGSGPTMRETATALTMVGALLEEQ